jgi:hypothetical protein
MKQVNKNEVDLLLRALARQANESQLQDRAAPPGSRNLSQHLDADELNSFAEGVLPDAARARYMEHLADCESCRGIVVGLTQASGAASPHRMLEQKTGAGFWQKLGVLFSPQVLRYAVPATALAAVIGISMIALRQRPESEFIAQNQDGRAAAPSGVQQTEIPAAPPANSASIAQQPNQPALTSDATKEKNKTLDDKTAIAKAPSIPAGTPTTSIFGKDGPPPSKAAAESEPLFAPDAKPGAAPPPRPAISEADSMRKMKEESINRDARARQQGEYQTQSADESGPNRSRSERNNTAPLNSRRIEGLAAGRGGPSNNKKDSNSSGETETRTVSGRSFRRQGNAWVDTAYDSSRTTVNVSRGSEQFRALTADEPGIGAIASQLGGEVIVVWKGRAYRIR